MDARTRRGRTRVNPMTHEHVPPACLANLRKYRYSGADYSLMSRYVLQNYWNFLVGLVPMTVAPNAITLTGFVIGLSASAVLLVYYCLGGGGGGDGGALLDKSGDATLYPAWTWYYAAISLFVYQTLDAMDGKQARRTGTGSPLGELFDHGCDAFLTPFVQLNTAACLRAPPWMVFCFLMQSALALFGAIWEQYAIGTMQLGYVSGPTEGIVLTCALFVLRGVCGARVWDTIVVGPYTWTLGPPASLSSSWWWWPSLQPVVVHFGTLRSILFVFFTTAWLATVLSNVTHALAWRRRPRGAAVRSCLSSYAAGAPMLVLACLHIALYAAYPGVQRRFHFVFELSFALLVTYTVSRMTIARLCAMTYAYTQNVLYMAMLAVATTALLAHVLGYSDRITGGRARAEAWLGYTLTALVVAEVVLYAHMIVSVFVQFARFLGIRILSIAPPTSSTGGADTSKRD